MRLSALIYAGVFTGLATFALAQEDEDVSRWRLIDDSRGETIVLAEHNVSTLDGKFTFECKRHSGTIHVLMQLDDRDQVEVGGVITAHDYPQFEFLPDTPFSDFKMRDYTGWEMEFDVDASSKFFGSFGQSGELRYRLVRDIREYTLPAGKEDVSAFVKGCSHE